MKARVNCYLNIRTGLPEVLPNNNPGYFKPNDIVEVVDTVRGADYKGNDLWYTLDSGGYVWSGGVNKESEESTLGTPYNYNETFEGIQKSWRDTLGEGIRIAIIDSGIEFQHPDLLVNKKNVFNECDSSFGAEDKIGHGTHCAGLIAANAKRSIGITGLAPKAELVIQKARHEEFKFDEKDVANCLNEAVKQKVDIISMSFKLPYSQSIELKTAISNASLHGVIMVASAGDNNVLTYSEFNKPAFYDEIISVGAIEHTFHTGNKKPYNSKLDYFLPLRPIISTTLKTRKYYEPLKGSSMATALVSGLIALLLKAENSIKRDKKSIKDRLDKIATSMDNFTSTDFTKLFKL